MRRDTRPPVPASCATPHPQSPRPAPRAPPAGAEQRDDLDNLRTAIKLSQVRPLSGGVVFLGSSGAVSVCGGGLGWSKGAGKDMQGPGVSTATATATAKLSQVVTTLRTGSRPREMVLPPAAAT